MKINKEALNTSIQKIAKEWDTSGGVVVLKDGNIIHDEIYGYEDRLNARPLTRKSAYVLHSESPFFVGLCIMKLIDAGQLQLTDKLSRFIPEYAYADQISLLHLLKSNTGIPDFFYHHLMLEMNDDLEHQALSEEERAVKEQIVFQKNRHFKRVFEIIGDKKCHYTSGEKDRPDSDSDAVFLAEVIRRVTGLSVFNYLNERVFKPIGMNAVQEGMHTQTISYTEIKENVRLRMPVLEDIEGVFTVTYDDLVTLLKAMAMRQIVSERSWKKMLSYDHNGNGIIFENANGFDCVDCTYYGFGFYAYVNHKTGIAFASIANEEQTYKHVDGEYRYVRRDVREAIEAAFTFPVKTKHVPISRNNLWQALTLKVDSTQHGYVLDAKSSVAMAKVYPTKRGFVQMEGNRAIGLLVLDIDKKKNYYNIDIILIDKRFQGRGYGKLMLKWAIERLEKEGARVLEIGVNRFNHAAKKIYLDAGFTPKAIYDGGMTLRLELGDK